jgi:hypothetical protein
VAEFAKRQREQKERDRLAAEDIPF